MTWTQADALDRLADRWLVPMSTQAWDPEPTYGRTAPLVLDIGCGLGATTVQQALAEPDTDILAIDVHSPGIGNLFAEAERHSVTNARAVLGDAVEVLDLMIRPESLAGARIYFPDPWPKQKHAKRRMIQPAFVELLVTRLEPGGFIHCATDMPAYADQMLQVLGANLELDNPHDGFAPRPPARPMTKFEARGLRRGHQIADVWVTRTLRP